MMWMESMQKAIDFMEDHLLEPITMEDIAKAANFSMFHFQRTFTILTDTSIAEYLRRRRLTLAAQELCCTNAKIIDLAHKYGYDTPEAFSKAFRRQHGRSPSEARKSKKNLNSFNRLVIQVSLKGADPMKYTIVEKEAFQAAGIKREYSLLDEENLAGIPKFWDEVNSDGTTEKLIHVNNGGLKAVLGICSVTEEQKARNRMEYWIAAAYEGDAPKNFSVIEIPASKWAVFEVHGAMPNAMQEVWNKIFTEWFPSNGYEHTMTPELEVYMDGDPSSEKYYSEIWIPIK